jgi:excisionase family DNA binding protein
MSLSNGVEPPGPLLTIAQAAAQLGISERTLRRWRRRKEIRTYRVAKRIRILQLDVDALLAPQEER